MRNKTVKLEDLEGNLKYRRLPIKELARIINEDLNREEYLELEGELSIDKAQKLKTDWEQN